MFATASWASAERRAERQEATGLDESGQQCDPVQRDERERASEAPIQRLRGATGTSWPTRPLGRFAPNGCVAYEAESLPGPFHADNSESGDERGAGTNERKPSVRAIQTVSDGEEIQETPHAPLFPLVPAPRARALRTHAPRGESSPLPLISSSPLLVTHSSLAAICALARALSLTILTDLHDPPSLTSTP